MSSELFEWIPLSRGDSLPPNAVYSGVVQGDGDVYIGKIDNSPGKVNLANGRVYNFWSQNYNSRTRGEVLVVHGKKEWVEVQYGEVLPKGAVCTGRDYRGDKVWVAKDVTTDEPGKLTCLDSTDPVPKMCRLWCHSYWGTADVKIAKVLVVSETQDEAVDEDIIIGEKPLWGSVTSFKSICRRLIKCNLDLSISNIVSSIVTGVKLGAGELSFLRDSLTSDIRAKADSALGYSEEGMKGVVSDKKKTTYVIIIYKKRGVQTSCTLQTLCGCIYTDFELDMTYAILNPLNDAAREECESFRQLVVDDIFRILGNLFAPAPSQREAL